MTLTGNPMLDALLSRDLPHDMEDIAEVLGLDNLEKMLEGGDIKPPSFIFTEADLAGAKTTTKQLQSCIRAFYHKAKMDGERLVEADKKIEELRERLREVNLEKMKAIVEAEKLRDHMQSQKQATIARNQKIAFLERQINEALVAINAIPKKPLKDDLLTAIEKIIDIATKDISAVVEEKKNKK